MNDKNDKTEETKEIEGRVRRAKRKIAHGVRDLLMSRFGTTEKKIVVERQEIRKTIPYDEDKIFLDKLEIVDGKVTGEFLVTEEACAGHVIGGQRVFRAVDIAEMVAQFLGVWAAQFPELKETLAFYSEMDLEVKAKFISAVVPGKVLIVEARRLELPKEEEANLTEEEAEEKKKNPKLVSGGRPDRPRRVIIGRNISVKVRGEKFKSTGISWISLRTPESESLAK